MDATQLIALLGHTADDPVVESAFVALRTLRRPALDPRDRDAFYDWVLVRRQGVELGFVDKVFYEAGPKTNRRRKGIPLVLCQIYFYTKREDISDYQGTLPQGLKW